MKWKIGDATITKITELEVAGKATWILPDLTAENLATVPWCFPHFAKPDGAVVMSIHALVIESQGRRHHRHLRRQRQDAEHPRLEQAPGHLPRRPRRRRLRRRLDRHRAVPTASSITSAGTPAPRTAAGCRPPATPATCGTAPSTSTGR
ncbi:MAG: hypothetical protein U0802_24595 [Candidatus Binatia bacterium]